MPAGETMDEIQNLSSNILGKASKCMVELCLGYCNPLDGKLSVCLNKPDFGHVWPERRELHCHRVGYRN